MMLVYYFVERNNMSLFDKLEIVNFIFIIYIDI